MLLSSLKSFVASNRSDGRGEAFGFDEATNETYLKWAFTHDYLFVVMDGDKVKAIGVAYPVKDVNDEESLFTFNYNIPKEKEHLYDLCIMDVISVDSAATKNLVKQFKLRYPNWYKCRKLALRFGSLKEINNKYINLL